MEAGTEVSKQTIEPQFLAKAQADGIRLRVGQMNKMEYEGVLRDIGRYEINLDAGGRTITLLKQEITHLTAPQPVITCPSPSDNKGAENQEAQAARPNVQQEFLDKAIRENQQLTIYLINGQRIRANLEGYDNFTLLLNEGGRQHLYYKHAITTINR